MPRSGAKSNEKKKQNADANFSLSTSRKQQFEVLKNIVSKIGRIKLIERDNHFGSIIYYYSFGGLENELQAYTISGFSKKNLTIKGVNLHMAAC